MSGLIIFAIVFCAAALLGSIGVIIFAVWDWRAWIRRKWGDDYKHGLARIKIGQKTISRPSELYYEGDEAITYARRLDEPLPGGERFVFDIVKNEIGFDYTETGRRVYRIRPGDAFAQADDIERPSVNFPSGLLSVHVADRTIHKYGLTVSGNKSSHSGLIIVVVLFVLLTVGGVIYMQNRTPGPAPVPTANTTQTQTNPPGYTGPYQGGTQ